VARVRRGFWLRFAAGVLKPLLIPLTRRTWLHRERIPLTGSAIIAINHISYADPLTVAHFIYDLPRNPQFLAKHTLFGIPLVGSVLRGTKQIPVRRNTRDAGAALEVAVEAVRDGAGLAIYPEGTCTKDPDLWPMLGKTGVARLALSTGAPVIPVAQWGAQAIHHPITRKVRIRRVPITMLVGEPVDLSAYLGRPLTGELLVEVTDLIMRRLTELVGQIRGEQPPDLQYDPVRAERSGRRSRAAGDGGGAVDVDGLRGGAVRGTDGAE
jgi:1-acyl-sn-glycerol-3-phosphate acyltransferase